MYEILAIAMKLDNRPQKEIERVLLSQVDYTAKDIPSMLYSSAFLSRMECYQQALNLYRQASALNETRPEPYLLGLNIARKLNDSNSIQWATVGILKHDWTDDYQKNHNKAISLANEEINNLKKQNKLAEARSFQHNLKEASHLDLEIELTWSGAGELDFFIKEPSGTVCSHENPKTSSGGLYLHDGFGPDQDNCFEKYVNRIAPSGEYVIRVQHIDAKGKIVGNRATLKVTQNKNSKYEKTMTRSVLIARTDSVIKFSLNSGRRKK